MLIPRSELQAIRRQVGPKTDEGRWDVTRVGAPTAEGAGFTRPVTSVVETVAGRLTFVGSMNVQERQRQGMLQMNANYLITLAAFTDVKVGDLIVENPLPWVATKYLFLGQRSQPTAANGKIYQVQVAGNTAATEPAWPATDGATVVDGGVTWRNAGAPEQYEVIEVMGSSTFGDYISRRVAANRRQL